MFAASKLPLSAAERAVGALVGADWSPTCSRSWTQGWSDGADIATLDQLSIRHGMTAMLAKALEEHRVELSPDVRHRVAARRQFLVKHALVQQSAIAAIADQAKATGTRWLLLKGHALGRTLYASPFIRECADIDILTDEGGAAALTGILNALGFTEAAAAAPDLGREARAMLHDLGSARTFDRADHVRVELHYRLIPQAGDFADFEELWRGRERFEFLGRELATFGRQDTLVFLIIHGAKHAWERWRWLTDVALALRRATDAEARAARDRVGAALFDSCLALIAAVTGEHSLAPARLPLRGRPLISAALLVARTEPRSPTIDLRRWLATAMWQACLVRNAGDLRRQLDLAPVIPAHVGRFSTRRSFLYPARLVTALVRRCNRMLAMRR